MNRPIAKVRCGGPSVCGLAILLLALCVGAAAPARAAGKLTLGMRDASLGEVMAMLARQHRVNILLGDNVEGEVSFNLYDVTLDEAIESIASAGGYVVERRQDTYFIMPEDRAGKTPGTGFTIVRSIPVQYADAGNLETKLSDYLSDFGTLTALPERKLIVVEDRPGFVYRITRLVKELDQRPPQVLIEAKILEIILSDEQSYGIDWTGLFTNGEGSGDFGTESPPPGNSANAGFFFNYLEPNIEVAIRALEADGRVRNLASPKVVTVVNEEAEVIIGDRRGYRVTTTINQVTTESIEFLESGTILRVTPTIDENGQILLNIHPEVSVGTVDENGIPSQTTTEVTTRLLVSSGQAIFIGGLMRNTTNETRAGVPILGRIPGVRWLFSSKSRTTFNTETVVIITPRLVDEPEVLALNEESMRLYDETAREMHDKAALVQEIIEDNFAKPPPAASEATDAGAPARGSEVTADAEGAETPPPSVVPTTTPEPRSVEPAPRPGPAPTAQATLARSPPAGVEPAPAESAAPPEADESAVPPEPAAAPAPEVAEPPTPQLAEPATPAPQVAEPETPAPQVAEPAPETGDTGTVASRPTAAGLFAVNLHSDPDPIEPSQVSGAPAEPQLLYVSTAELDGETWHRLRLGFFATESEAQQALEAWRDDFPNAWLVRVAPRERDAAPASALTREAD